MTESVQAGHSTNDDNEEAVSLHLASSDIDKFFRSVTIRSAEHFLANVDVLPCVNSLATLLAVISRVYLKFVSQLRELVGNARGRIRLNK